MNRASLPLLLLALVCSSRLPAQPPPAAPVNPQAPTLNPVVPLGMQRGTTLELTLTGANLADPTGLVTSFPPPSPSRPTPTTARTRRRCG
ncbi:MAG: hypothetical protein U0736_28125 [Gemmataceae bacterium]